MGAVKTSKTSKTLLNIYKKGFTHKNHETSYILICIQFSYCRLITLSARYHMYVIKMHISTYWVNSLMAFHT